MARGPKHLGLKPGPADEIFAAILDWKNRENPPPEKVIEWLTETCRIFTGTINAFDSHRELIKQLGEPERREAGSVVLNCLDYIERAEAAGELMAGVVGGRVRDAFVEGVRIGLLYERILSHIDGRFTEKWRKEDSRRRGASTTNAAHAELWSQYQSSVEQIMREKGIAYSSACELAAEKFGVSSRTIKAHTTNPDPKNRGRPGSMKPL